MYPYMCAGKRFPLKRNKARIAVLDTYISDHICWPWDIDILGELNNGRALSLFDLGR